MMDPNNLTDNENDSPSNENGREVDDNDDFRGYEDNDDEYGSSTEKYGGYNGFSDDVIDDAFEGDPEATWNVD